MLTLPFVASLRRHIHEKLNAQHVYYADLQAI